jgi:hypothetical protein
MDDIWQVISSEGAPGLPGRNIGKSKAPTSLYNRLWDMVGPMLGDRYDWHGLMDERFRAMPLSAFEHKLTGDLKK